MSKYQIHSPFVCLDDITGCREEMNVVIYNPKDTQINRIALLDNVIKSRFNKSLDTTQLIHLSEYDASELNCFVEELRYYLHISI